MDRERTFSGGDRGEKEAGGWGPGALVPPKARRWRRARNSRFLLGRLSKPCPSMALRLGFLRTATPEKPFLLTTRRCRRTFSAIPINPHAQFDVAPR
jgi:hypothetical protein